MSEWGVIRLGDLAEVKGGKRLPKGELLSNIPSAHPYVRITDMQSKWLNINENSVYVDPNIQPAIRNYTVDSGDVILSIVGHTIGLVARIGETLHKANLTENCVKILPKNTKSNKDFIYYFLVSNFGQSEIDSKIVGSSQPKLPLYNIKDIEIPVPPLPEQKAIASVLSSLDDKIDLLYRQNKTLEAMAETLFRQWFIEEAKEDWEEVKLGDLCEVITKGTTPKQFAELGINFIKAESLTDTGSFIRSKFASVTSEIHEGFLKRSILQKGDLLFSIAGTVGRVAKVTADILPANTNQALAILRPKANVNSDLIYCILKSSYFQELADGKVVHAVQPNLSLGEISNSCIRLPDQKVLKVFTEQVNAYFDKKNTNAKQIQTLEKLRDNLLPKLMSGEVRVQY